MKRRYFLLTLLSASLLSAAGRNIHVSPDGDDANPATLSRPLATLRAAQSLVSAGDTVYFRGGTYHITEQEIMSTQENIYACVFDLARSGTSGRRIVYAGYPGERPVFDLSGVRPEGKRVSVFYIRANYLHLKNFDIVGTQVTITTHTQSEAISIRRGGSYNIIEDVAIHDGMSIGVYITRGAHNLVLNCDAYNNYDSVSEGGRGGNSDGFGCHVRAQDVDNVFRGCRAWCNSDDGFDLINCFAPVTFDHCWAMFSGYRDIGVKTSGDGNGFKAGGYGKQVQKSDFDAPRHTITNCIAYGNKANGFYANHHLGGNDWLNNTAWKNKYNYCMVNQKQWDEAVDVDGYGHVLRSNVSFEGIRGDYAQIDIDRCTVLNNSFLPVGHAVAEGDFISTDYLQLMRGRAAGGALPSVTFLQLRPGSALFAAGMGWQFAPSDVPDTAIGDIVRDDVPSASPAAYSLSGIAVRCPRRGIIIRGNKKSFE